VWFLMQASGGLPVYNPHGLNLGNRATIIVSQITSGRNH
jgi:hypothetical protein